MQLARSLLFALIFYSGTLLFVLAGIAASAIGTGPMRSVVHSWADFQHWLARFVLGIRTEVTGQLPPGPLLIAVKHESMFETIEILRVTHTPAVVMKRELSTLPLFGWLTRRYGIIPVDREAGAKALRELLAKGKAAAESGRPIVIFPEGTRVPHGQIAPLGAGFAGLYRVLGLPVVPIALDSGKLWTRGVLKKRGTVTFRIGEVIPPGLKREEIERRVLAEINVLNASAPQARP
jgi:1-acyl-sn-glycerol-3-phosphate acyltransferase